MLVCHCRSIYDKDIRLAIKNGDTSLPMIQQTTDAATSCGTCVYAVYEIMEEEGLDISEIAAE